ncbi:ABC transporter substrate-binding protein [Streptomyces sp. JJ36]|uniref:ABC transporter substrate-binding protein n=1 Tax=Streptomyces sp. JJ36 TaxID=2736645 RepID=UPI001F2189AB|nr:ABC transporter substrate-binding protein [Streptomyces sp. JJ36]MCF6521965.1 ABC transporter family substrate-binding protein [Streptomyces sp. JJ36]
MPAVPAHDTAARRCAAVLAATLLLPVAAACSGEGDDAPRGSSGAARDLRTVARDEVAEGGTLRWAVEEMPATLNVFQPDATRATDRIAGAVLPALFTLDSRARPHVNTDFLQDAEVTSTRPRQTVVYTLEPEARWSDGRAIGVADFKAQWKALKGSDSAFWTARNAGYEQIAQVRKGEEPHQVEVVFRKRYADWQALFTPLYPKQVMARAEAFNEKARHRLPAYAGPFRVKGRIDPEKDDAVTLERNPEWWGDRAKLDRIELPAVPYDEREKALAAGKLDLADVGPGLAERIADARIHDGKARRDGAAHRDAAPGDRRERHGEAAGTGPREAGEAAAPAGLPPRAAGPDRAIAAVLELAYAERPAEPAGEEEREDGAAREKNGDESGDASAREAGTKSAKNGSKKQAAEHAAARERAAAARRNLGGYTVRKALEPAYTQLALNGASGPLSDDRVRRALARALDREALAQHALGSVGLPARPLGSHLQVRDQHGYRDNSDALGGRDVASAEALLAEAGWEAGVGEEEQDEPVDAKKGDGKGADGKRDDGKSDGKGDGKGGQDAPADGPGEAEEGTDARATGALAVPVAPAEAARVRGVPLSLLPHTAAQRAGLLAQAAHASAAEAGDGEDAGEEADADSAGEKAATARRAAEDARERAEEMRLLSGGRAAAVRMKEGQPLALRFLVPAGPGTEGLQQTGTHIVRMLNEIGVRTEVKLIKDESWFRDHIASGDYDLALYSWPASAFPATDARPIFAKPVPAPDGSLVVEQNWTRVGTDRIDQLFAEAAAELDEQKRADLLRRADARIWAAAGSVPLYQRPQLVAAKRELANAGAFGFQTPRYQDIGYVE